MTRLERDALKVVNRIRRAEGRKPLNKLPKGKSGKSFACPIARSLDHGHVWVGENNALVIPLRKLATYLAAGLKMKDETVELKMPKSFDRFIKWFDNADNEESKKLSL